MKATSTCHRETSSKGKHIGQRNIFALVKCSFGCWHDGEHPRRSDRLPSIGSRFMRSQLLVEKMGRLNDFAHQSDVLRLQQCFDSSRRKRT
jgi:hypothetical protein